MSSTTSSSEKEQEDMPHYAGTGTNFSEERTHMSETTPESTPDTTAEPDGQPDTSQPTAPAPDGETLPDGGDNSNPDAVTDGSVAEEGLPE